MIAQFELKIIKNDFVEQKTKSRIIFFFQKVPVEEPLEFSYFYVPWYIMCGGLGAAAIVFALELVSGAFGRPVTKFEGVLVVKAYEKKFIK